MLDRFVVGLIQDAAIGRPQDNLAHSLRMIEEAAKKGAQIICLKELFNSRYFCTVEEHARFDLAESIPGPTTDALQRLAKKLQVAIVAPLFERRGPGVYHNSAAVIDADGSLLGVYRKMHIPDDPLYYEKFYFSPGDEGFKVFKTQFATIGVLICWDQWYPEASRITALKGADALFFPTAIGWHPKEKAEFGSAQVSAWQTIQRSHAIANGIYVASVNRIGHEPTPNTDGIEFFGHSFICDPFGRVLSSSDDQKESILIAECSKRHLEDTRRHWPFLRDRRIDAYGPILNRYLGK
ncbi:MAG: N-carbamoyl-D-amino acid hydrolase [Parachlamydiales bacterium]|nr:N-carbamoyl-D-amino acid hydrolase [Parachlamydiales bacterium]